MKRIAIAAVLVLLATLCAQAAPGGAARLAAGGKSRVSVVLPAGSAPLVKAAARDLAHCLGVAIGAKVPLVAAQAEVRTPLTIVVGPHPGIEVSGLARDGCMLKTVGKRLIITGRTPSGVSNGVYTFLIDQVGARWFSPQPLYQVIPHRPDLLMPKLNYRRNPDFRYRMLPGEPAPSGPAWQQRNRLDADASGMSRFNFGHNIGNIIQASKYGKTHPEYFAMIDGRRKVPTYDAGTNPCFTNPDVVAIAAKAAHEFFAKNPQMDTFSVSINDDADHCQCPRCWALDKDLPLGQGGVVAFSGSYFQFVRKVAEIVAKTDPGKYIGCFPYWPVYPLPPHMKPLPHNVALILTQDSSQQHDPAYLKAERAHWIAWRSMCSSMARYDYYDLGWITPRYYAHLAASDLKFLHAHACDGFFCAIAPEWCVLGPQVYVASRLLWDSSLNTDTLLADYYRSLYGPAAGDMKHFYGTLERYWMQPRPARWFEGLAGITSEYTIVNGPLIEEAWRALGKAEAATTGVQHERVVDVKTHFRFSYLLVKMLADAKALGARRLSTAEDVRSLGDDILRTLALMPEAKKVYREVWMPDPRYNTSYYSSGGMNDRLRDWSYELHMRLTAAAHNAHRFTQTLPASERDAVWGAFRDKLLARDADLGTQGLVHDYRADFDKSDAAIDGGAGYSTKSNKDGTLAWAESYLLSAYVEMYRATGDRDYLQRLVAQFDRVLQTRDDVTGTKDAFAGKPLAGWGSDTYSGGKWHVWIVHTGMIEGGPARFVRLVAEDRALQPEFGAKAAEYRARLEESIHDTDPYWHDGPAPDEGWYYGAYLGKVLPLNQQNAMGLVLLDMYRATGNRAYLDKVESLAHYFHRRLRYAYSDYFDWAYWPKLDDDGEGSEDTSHAGINVEFAARCAEAGIVFTKPEVVRIARTWLQMVRRPDGTWADTIDGKGKGNTYMPYAVGFWLPVCPLVPETIATKLCEDAVRAFGPERLHDASEMLGVARLLYYTDRMQ